MRKQAAVTLRCMQALVRVQARVRARRVRLALESETGQQTLQQQLADEARVREIEVTAIYICLSCGWLLIFLERITVMVTMCYNLSGRLVR